MQQLLMRSKHNGTVAEEPVSYNAGLGFLPAICAALPDENNFWPEVNPHQQQSARLSGGVDKPHSHSLNLPAFGWSLVFISFPSVTQSDNIVLAYVCTPWLDN